MYEWLLKLFVIGLIFSNLFGAFCIANLAERTAIIERSVAKIEVRLTAAEDDDTEIRQKLQNIRLDVVTTLMDEINRDYSSIWEE